MLLVSLKQILLKILKLLTKKGQNTKSMVNQNDAGDKEYPLGQPIDYADPKNLSDEATVDIASINGLGNVEGAEQPANPNTIDQLRTPVKPDKSHRVIPVPGISATEEGK